MNQLKNRTFRRRSLIESLEDRRLLAAGPYAPAAELPGSDAISRTDPAIVGWATAVADYSPGSNVDAIWTNASEALGPAEAISSRIVSLGRGGTLTVTFDKPIRDGLGDDFAVFENSFSDTFLELGFVEVSSDGVTYFRFDSDSKTIAPVAAFGTLDPTNLNNLAGKYRGGFGTPFDLAELRGRAGLDVTAVTHVRLVDIVGDGNTRDASGDPIYDPTPTVGSAGLDVDGIAVIHSQSTSNVIVDFEKLGASIDASGFDNGAGGSGRFVEDEITLSNNYNTQYSSWSGFSISQATDANTAGFANQYSAVTGIGHNNSPTYAVGYFPISETSSPPTITLDPSGGSKFDSFYVTNTTYAALSMRSGDGFAKRFGGDTGNDADLFRLIVTGIDASGNPVGNVNVDLADYRFLQNSQDYIVDQWTRVDVSSLAAARSLRFSMTSTDTGQYGINTPTYFAIDDVTLTRAAVPFDLSESVTKENQSVTGRVSRPTSDSSAAIDVMLNRTGTDAASMPTSVTIQAGMAFAEFNIVPTNDSVPTPDRSLQVTASANGLVSTTRTLTIQDDEVLAVSFDNAVLDVIEGDGNLTTLLLTRNDADVSQSLTAMITRSTTSLLSVPTSVTFGAGERHVTVPINVLDDSLFDGTDSVLITASVPGRDPASITVDIAEDDLPSLQATPTTIVLNEGDIDRTRTITINRNTVDASLPVTVTLQSLDDGPLIIPAFVTIAAGSSSADFVIGVFDDATENALTTYRVLANHPDYVSTIIQVNVIDNDQTSLDLEFQNAVGDAIASATESSPFLAIVRRIGSLNTVAQTVELSATLDGQPSDRIVGPTSVTIPPGSDQVIVSYEVTSDGLVTGDVSMIVTALAVGLSSVSSSILINDADRSSLTIAVDNNALLEQNASTVADFETLGRGLFDGEYDNDAGSGGRFVSGPIAFENTFDDSYGFDSWSGFTISQVRDTQTRGFVNQYSAYTGTGASGSKTYGIAYAGSPVTVAREAGSPAFESVAVTNATYAALSMLNGDAFAKAFGGVTGNDPDFFLLTIDGSDDDGNSIGTVDFYLADYRFDDNSLDYLIDQWTTVDVSSIGQATTLSMRLSSSDNGSFGMNTPGYFAIDDVTLQPSSPDVSMVTITRTGATDQPLTIALSDDRDDVNVPFEVAMGAGQSSVRVPVSWRNDDRVNGPRSWTITAAANGFESSEQSVSLVDDDVDELSVVSVSGRIDEAGGIQTVGFEDVGASLDAESFANGSDRRGGFDSGSLHFPNAYDSTFGSWSGWAASNVTDTTTSGFTNQYAAYSGSGAEGSPTFVVGGGYGVDPLSIAIPDSFANGAFESIAVTNTTYAALSMAQGDQFAKKFGGVTGSDADFFLLMIEGFDGEDQSVGVVDFYLADYQFGDDSSDYIVDQWTTVDLTSLVGAKRLTFSLSSSDVGDFGMNTPAYFAIDDLIVDRVPVASPIVTVFRNNVDVSTDLAVTLQSSDPSRLSVPNSIVIPAGTDRVAVPVTVNDDAIYQALQNIQVTATATGYAAGMETIEVQNDDAPRVLIAGSQNNFELVEDGQPISFDISLEAAPATDLTVVVQTTGDQLRFAPATFTFTTTNWDLPQTLTVSSPVDLRLEPTTVIPVQLVVSNGEIADAIAYIELIDYQPQRLTLENKDGEIRLNDESRSLSFGRYESQDDIDVRLSDANQSLTLRRLTGASGLIQIHTGGGDDIVNAYTSDFTSIDGGSGADTILIAPQDLPSGETLDLERWLRNRVVRFETIVLGSADSSDPISMRFGLDSGKLKEWFGDARPRLVTSAHQILNLSGNWQLGLPALEGGVLTGRLVGEGIEVTVSTQYPWQNFLLKADVNANGSVTSTDALTIINRLNANPTSELPPPGSIEELQGNFYDVSGDGLVTAIDALQVINYLNTTDPGGEPFAFDDDWNTSPVANLRSIADTIAISRDRSQVETVETANNPTPTVNVIRLVEDSGVTVAGRSDALESERSDSQAVDAAFAELDLLADPNSSAGDLNRMRHSQ